MPCIRLVSQIRAPLAACREPVGSDDPLRELWNAFEHKNNIY